MKRTFLFGLSLAVVLSSYADAALIVAVTATTNTSTANTSTGTGTDKREFNSVLNTVVGSAINGDFVGSTATVSTRLSALTVADKDSNTFGIGGTTSQNATVNYTITFDVADPGVGRIYSVSIDTLRFGELTVLNESSGVGGSATLTLGAVTATYTGAGSPTGSNNLLSLGYTSPNSNNNTQYFRTAVNQSGNVTVAGLTGANTITLGFSWLQNASSSSQPGLGNAKGDDGAIRLGRTTTTNGTAGIYPGVDSRDISLDGHFVSITAEITAITIPEPTSAAFLACCAAGIGVIRRRR